MLDGRPFHSFQAPSFDDFVADVEERRKADSPSAPPPPPPPTEISSEASAPPPPSLEASAPPPPPAIADKPNMETSAPTAPPAVVDQARASTGESQKVSQSHARLSDELKHMSPHLTLQPALDQEMRNLTLEERLEIVEDREQLQQEPLVKPKPLTSSQLAGFYVNSQLLHNEQFIEAFLADQANVERNELHDLLTNYRRVRATLISLEKKAESLREEIKDEP